MFEGVYSSIADYGANRTLGMGGSLSGYINTGNPYDRHYYHRQKNCKDTFTRKRSRKITDKIISYAAIIGAGAVALFALFKKGDKKAIDKTGKTLYGCLSDMVCKLAKKGYNLKTNTSEFFAKFKKAKV